jgi:hypothetical protein
MHRVLSELKKDLGNGNSRHLILGSALFSITFFFWLLSVVSLFQPIVYPFIDRITYPSYFEDKYFVNDRVDFLVIISCTTLWFLFSIPNKKKYFIVAAIIILFSLTLILSQELATEILATVSFPIILLFIIINKIRNKDNVSFNLKLTVNYISVFSISIAIVSAFALTCYIFLPEIPLPPLNYTYLFFIIFSIPSPIYLLLIAFGYPIALAFQTLRKMWTNSSVVMHENMGINKGHLSRRVRILLLSVIIILSIVVSTLPSLSIVNQNNNAIGTDTKYYIRYLETIADSSGYEEILHKAFVTIVSGDRPFSLLIFYWLSTIFYQGNFYFLLENLPVILSPLLVISIYFLALGLTKNHLAAVFASLLTIPSHILIGIYAGLYANWFALIWGYFAFTFLFKMIEKPKKTNLIIFSVLLIIVLFSHAQTWTIFMYLIGIFTAVLFFKNKTAYKKGILYIIFSILPSILIDLVRLFLINFSGVSQELNYALSREVGIHGLAIIWDNLIETAYLYLAGQIANPIILILVIYWLYSTKIKESYTIFLVIFFLLFAFPLLFGDESIQARFFYEIPFQIPAAIAMIVLGRKVGSLLPFAICLWLTVMSFYMVTNFDLVIPEKYL